MHQENRHMKDNGLMINFKVKVHFIMKNHKHFMENLIIKIMIKLESNENN